MRTLWQRALAVLLVLTCTAASGFSDEGRDKVKEGIRLFENGEYVRAEKVFAEAGSLISDAPAIAFNQGCAFQARREWDQAIHHYSKAAQARETGIATAARFNLGTVNVARATELFGESPEAADQETREKGLDVLTSAIGCFRECLDVNPDHDGARRNVEAIRIWIKQMTALWEELDRQKLRDELDLFQFLEMIIKGQKEIRDTTTDLGEAPESPRRRQAAWVLGRSQKRLAEEIVFLKKKMVEFLTSQGLPGSPQGENPLVKLNGLADEAGDAMTRSSEILCLGSVEDSHEPQQEALDRLQQIKEELEKLNQEEEKEPDLLEVIDKIQKKQLDIREATTEAARLDESPERLESVQGIEKDQRDLIEETEALDEKIEETLNPQAQTPPGQAPPPEDESHEIDKAVALLQNWAKEAGQAMDQAVGSLAAQAPDEAREPQWQGFDHLDRIFDVVAPFQNLVGRAVGAEKALVDETTPLAEDAGLEEPDADARDMRRFQDRVTRWGELFPLKADAMLQQFDAMESQAAAQPGTQPGAQPAPMPDEAKEQIAKIREACAKAKELSPEIVKLSGEAAALLEQKEFEQALPKEEDVLALLEEIAKLLPEQKQQKKGNDGEDRQKDEEEKEQDENKEEQEKQPEQQEDKEEEEKEKEEAEPPSSRELTPEEAEAILRQARERERQYQEEKEKARKARAVRGGVEKDW